MNFSVVECRMKFKAGIRITTNVDYRHWQIGYEVGALVSTFRVGWDGTAFDCIWEYAERWERTTTARIWYRTHERYRNISNGLDELCFTTSKCGWRSLQCWCSPGDFATKHSWSRFRLTSFNFPDLEEECSIQYSCLVQRGNQMKTIVHLTMISTVMATVQAWRPENWSYLLNGCGNL